MSFPLLFVLTILGSVTVFAQVPRQISYQGVLLQQNGTTISDGVHVLKVKIYDAPVSGTTLYSESISTTTASGVFNVVIGASSPIPATIDFSTQYWLGVAIDGDSEMTPRTAFTAAPYSLHAEVADLANSVSADAHGVVTSVNEVDGPLRIIGDSTMRVEQNGRTITLSAFSTGSGSGGIQSLQSPQKTIALTFPNGPVTSLDVRDSAITTAKIQDGAVTLSKLNPSGANAGQVLRWNGLAWTPSTISSSGGSGWLLTGNSGTTAGVNFIGTTDSNAVDLRSDNSLVLRLNPNASLQHEAGGNARGNGAVDLQASSTLNSEVASGSRSTIGGGEDNTASNTDATVGGGVTNTASGSYSTVGGGGNNIASDVLTTVAGGAHNTASGSYSAIGGGETNYASGNSSVISGGAGDTATAYGTVIGGGVGNIVRGISGTISGGSSNFAGSNYYPVIAGGGYNSVSGGDASTISGGAYNTINGAISTISGGYSNYLGGNSSTIAGGSYLRLVGDNSFGFHAGTGSADSAYVQATKTAFFGNVDLWIGNTDTVAHQLRLYEAQSGGVTFPGANTNYTALKAGTQSANITYTMPSAAASANGALLLSTTTGAWSWTSNLNWDNSNSRLGINTTSPATGVDINGDLATREHPLTLVNGLNNNVAVGSYSFIQITGPNAAFTITGITGGANGKIVVLYNSTGQVMTINNNDNNSGVGNRIYTGSGNAYITPNGYVFDTVTLMYSASKNGWLLVSHN